MTISLTVTAREKGAQTDRTTQVVGVVYGPKQESTPLTIDRPTFEKLYKEAGESTIISLEGIGEPMDVLIHDIDIDPVRGTIRHVDFYAIERGKEITVDVPLEFVGTAPAEEQNGVLTKVLHEVEVTCRPSKLPHNIEVDVSVMTELDQPIKIKDLALPEGVKVENDPEEVVAIVVPVEEEVEEPVAPIDMDSIEVEHKGKEEEEGKSDSE